MTVSSRLIPAFIIFFLSIVLLGCSSGPEEKDALPQDPDPKVFRLTSHIMTGIYFENTLTEGLNTNILMYEYFYNGGGVATGDLNGDGYLDLYFTSNMEANKLYVNEGINGKLKFKDVTQISGASGRSGPWKTGVNLVDINGDNRLDIYICYSGTLPESKRINQLFINMGNDPEGIPQFEEKAAEFGLASRAYSNQSYFFDYDRDGDLDMLLLNHNPKNLPILNEVQTRELLAGDDPHRGIRLFRQDDGYFTDITIEAGINASALSYGLGLGISDLNADGWPDFYVSNDYAVPDYLYLNNQNGTFRNVLPDAIGHNSQFSMGNDIADINNDGFQDIITLDMLPEDNRRQKLLLAPDNYNKFDHNLSTGFYYQYMRNMLQLNNGNGTFSEIGQFSGISNTDWSWSALLADYDNDGWKDLYITNGYHRDYTNLDFINYMEDFVEKKGRLQREDVLEIIKNMPASDVPNYLYQGMDGLRFTKKTAEWGVHQIANSNGAVYGDLDNDGDLDLVVNNINRRAFVYENLTNGRTDKTFFQVALEGSGMNTQGIGAEVTVSAAGKSFILEQYSARGYLSSVSPVLHFGLGSAELIDSLVVRWPDGKEERKYQLNPGERIVLQQKNAQPAPKTNVEVNSIFTSIAAPVSYTNPKLDRRDFDRQSLLISELSCSGPSLISEDFNRDGLPDLFIGGAAGQAARVYLQRSNGSFQLADNPDFALEKQSEDSHAAVLDLNKDGHLDLYLASGGYHQFQPEDALLQDRIYLNNGDGIFTKAEGVLPQMLTSTSVVSAADFNGDGNTDLFVGGRVVPGRYPEVPTSYLLVNDGKGHFQLCTPECAPDLSKPGMVTDAKWADLNQDGWQDLVVVGEWMPVSVFENQQGKLVNKTSKYFDKSYSGFWNTIEVADLNQDNIPDLVVGNIGTNVQFQASEDQPAEIFYADFDQNGSVDPVYCYYIQGQSYPYVTRDELLKQMVAFRSKYTSYESFADVTIRDLFTQEELDKAGHLTINHTKTSVFLSTPDNTYEQKELPVQAQFSPIYTMSFLDFDQDGAQDLLLCGNNSRLKLRLGKSDANYGMLFKGDGKGGFAYIDQVTSGLKLKGDIRSVVRFGDLMLFGKNQGDLDAYKLNTELLQ